MNYTTISVDKETKERLEKLMRKGETYPDVINRLIDFYIGKTAVENEIIILPEDRYNEVLDVIEKVKPPSKWRDMTLLFLFSLFGGTGIGLALVLM